MSVIVSLPLLFYTQLNPYDISRRMCGHFYYLRSVEQRALLYRISTSYRISGFSSTLFLITPNSAVDADRVGREERIYENVFAAIF